MDVQVRPLCSDEGALLDAVFTGLSPESRYLRFHAPIHGLTESLRGVLLDVDGRNHVALVAVSDRGEAVGIARLVRDPRRRDEAEVAFEVVDAWQGRGVGRRLLTGIVEAAGEVGGGWGQPGARMGAHPKPRRAGPAAGGVRSACPALTAMRPSCSACCPVTGGSSRRTTSSTAGRLNPLETRSVEETT
jgi:GNAT superfamily N-acetyltransferase